MPLTFPPAPRSALFLVGRSGCLLSTGCVSSDLCFREPTLFFSGFCPNLSCHHIAHTLLCLCLPTSNISIPAAVPWFMLQALLRPHGSQPWPHLSHQSPSGMRECLRQPHPVRHGFGSAKPTQNPLLGFSELGLSQENHVFHKGRHPFCSWVPGVTLGGCRF